MAQTKRQPYNPADVQIARDTKDTFIENDSSIKYDSIGGTERHDTRKVVFNSYGVLPKLGKTRRMSTISHNMYEKENNNVRMNKSMMKIETPGAFDPLNTFQID